MYKVTKLSQAREIVAAQSEQRIKNKSVKPVLTDEYRRLFDVAAASTERQKEGWSYCFNRGEITLLAEYIFEKPDRTKEEVKALLEPVKFSGGDDLAAVLYRAWQDNYDNPNYARVFEFMRENKELEAQFIHDYTLQPSILMEDAIEGNVVIYVSKTASYEGDGTYESFIKCLASFGLDEETKLYKECINCFVMVCDGRTYMKMGVEKVENYLDNFEGMNRRVFMRNMLRVMDSYQLKTFVSLVPKFNEYLGGPEDETYKKVMRKLSKEVQDKYQLWQNQFFVYDVLGKGERADFWAAYADAGKMKKHPKTDILYITFKTFTVVEFATSEAAYFFANDYMEDTIYPMTDTFETEQEVEDWIYKNTEWGSDKTHKDHWRKAHMASWQIDMKSYMNGIFRKYADKAQQ